MHMGVLQTALKCVTKASLNSKILVFDKDDKNMTPNSLVRWDDYPERLKI